MPVKLRITGGTPPARRDLDFRRQEFGPASSCAGLLTADADADQRAALNDTATITLRLLAHGHASHARHRRRGDAANRPRRQAGSADGQTMRASILVLGVLACPGEARVQPGGCAVASGRWTSTSGPGRAGRGINVSTACVVARAKKNTSVRTDMVTNHRHREHADKPPCWRRKRPDRCWKTRLADRKWWTGRTAYQDGRPHPEATAPAASSTALSACMAPSFHGISDRIEAMPSCVPWARRWRHPPDNTDPAIPGSAAGTSWPTPA